MGEGLGALEHKEYTLLTNLYTTRAARRVAREAYHSFASRTRCLINGCWNKRDYLGEPALSEYCDRCKQHELLRNAYHAASYKAAGALRACMAFGERMHQGKEKSK